MTPGCRTTYLSIKKEEDYNQVFFPLPLSLNKISLPLHFQNIANGK